MLVVGGSTDGYLSPCGCTKPMSGGIRRRATVLEMLRAAPNSVLVENGGLAKGISRQDQLKAEALIQVLNRVGIDALNITAADAALGLGGITSLKNLAPNLNMVNGHVIPNNRLGIAIGVHVKGTYITSVTKSPDSLRHPLGVAVRSAFHTIDYSLREANDLEAIPVLMYDGDLDSARKLPGVEGFRVVVYRSSGSPPSTPVVVGNTVFVTPGEKGKFVTTIEVSATSNGAYRVYDLWPDVADSAAASKVFKDYLRRVATENLLKSLPRRKTPAFAGNAKCMSCHTKAAKVWKGSAHSKALATLEREGHDRDPDCVGCHVVGLSSSRGFVSKQKTPALTNVGCESCHGPGAIHAARPKTVRMPKSGQKSCISCHDRENSPNFDFRKYWQKIAH